MNNTLEHLRQYPGKKPPRHDAVRETQSSSRRLRRRWGISRNEVIGILIIIGILTAIAVPLYSAKMNTAKEAAAKTAIGSVRSAIRVKEGQSSHLPGQSPRYPETITFAMFADGKIPENPANTLSTVSPWDGVSAPTNDSGWQYNSATGDVRLNSPGTDSRGIAWTNY